MIQRISNYINGLYVEPVHGQYLDNFCPATGEKYGELPDSDGDDIEAAYRAAKGAFTEWSRTSAEVKFHMLNRIAVLIERDIQVLAEAESMDQGKPIHLAVNEMKRAAQNFRFFATAAMHFASESHDMDGKAINYTLRQPLGVVGCISPWNLPLYLFSWKIAPALAAGNCVIAKPSEITPMTAYMLGEICTEAGLPPGVLNIVQGRGQTAGSALVSHRGISAISFTGGTATGAQIASVVAPTFRKLSLELGGKNPNIIFDDCDFEKAVKTTVSAAFLNQGEICLCGSRIFVQKGIYTEFKEALLREVSQMKVGNPSESDTQIGAIVSRQHFEKILGHIEIAKQEGGRILCGGNAVRPEGQGGWFIAPTIIEGLDNECRTNQEEIFGPVATLIPFENETEVLELANGTGYGLATTLWTSDLGKAHRIAQHIQTGIVWVNCWLLRDLRTPFGGMKNSGVGREGGWEAMRFFTEPKNVCIKHS
jgi:aminomuconate-semialdehyde/2-hydroxymuconate-6-semialdehyde dehydrogenase